MEIDADLALLDDILRQTIDAIKESQSQIGGIANEARAEAERIGRELEKVKKEMLAIVERVDAARVEEQRSRAELMRVSRDFKQHGEEDIRRAYERARDAQVEVILLTEQEKALWYKRDEIERHFQSIQRLLKRAETLATQVSVALDYLSGNVQQLSQTLESVQEKREIAVRIIRAQEEERRRVARDLHDGLAQHLASALLELEVTQRLLVEDTARAQQELRNVEQIIRGSLREARDVIFNLRPLALDNLGLKVAVDHLAAQISERTGLEVNVAVFGNERPLDSTTLSCVFRIIQEALNNVVKHAEATWAQVRIEFSLTLLVVQIADDGCGFTVDAHWAGGADGEEHLGLIGMQERANLLGGALEIKSSPGQGTRVKFSLPLKPPEPAQREGGEEGK